MLEKVDDLKRLVTDVKKYLFSKKRNDLAKLLLPQNVFSKQVGYDNWDGGIFYYRVYVEVPLNDFTKLEPKEEEYEQELLEAFNIYMRRYEDEVIEKVVITPLSDGIIDWSLLQGIVAKDKLIEMIQNQRKVLIDVATYFLKIEDVDEAYQKEYLEVSGYLEKIDIEYPNAFGSLWNWCHYWKENELITYVDRRNFIFELFHGLLSNLSQVQSDNLSFDEPTGWEKVDRSILFMREQLQKATHVEQFQSVGHLGRETLISIAQQVYDYDIYGCDEGSKPSKTDAKRMLRAYIGAELNGKSNEGLRKFSKATIDFANELTHDRSATKREAMLGYVGVSTVARIVKILDENKST